MNSDDLIFKDQKFYIDTGAEISIIKERIVKGHIPIDTTKTIEVHGITSGDQQTLGAISININGLSYIFHVVKNDINLEVDGLIGCDNLQMHGAKIDMNQKFMESGSQLIPFEKGESYIISGRSRQIIHVNIKNNNISEGIMPKLE